MQEERYLIGQNSLRCKNDNQAVALCCNSQCLQNAFTCLVDKCSCHSHDICSMIKSSQLLILIQKQKTVMSESNTKSINAILKIYDQVIEFLSTKRLEFEQSIDLLGLNSKTVAFIKSVQTAKIDSINGKFISDLQCQCKQPSKPISLKPQSHFKSINQKILKQVQVKIEQLEEDCQVWRSDLNSSIITYDDQLLITKQFQNANIKFKKLFHASEANFQVKAFREKCKIVGPVLTLIQTSQGKNIAAYQQSGWKSIQYDYWNCPIDCQICRSSQKDKEIYIRYPFVYFLTDKKIFRVRYLDSTNRQMSDQLDIIVGPIIGYRQQIRMLYISEDCNTSFENYIKDITDENPIFFQVKDYEVFEISFL